MKGHGTIGVLLAALLAGPAARLGALEPDRSASYHPPKMDALFRDLGPALPFGALEQLAGGSRIAAADAILFDRIKLDAEMALARAGGEDPLDVLLRELLAPLEKYEDPFAAIAFALEEVAPFAESDIGTE